MDDIKNAVIDDPRVIQEIDKDYVHEELYSGMPVVWIEKKQWKIPTNRNQDGSFSCVKQSSATAIEVLTKNVISAGTYQLRSNAPSGGMWLQNCGDIDYKQGFVFESLVPSQDMSDPVMDAITLPVLTSKISGYRTFNELNVEKVAEAIQAYGNCILTFGIGSGEWRQTPVYLGTEISFNHAICGVDFALIDGVKTIICMDSAGKGNAPDGVRNITEDYMDKRGKDAMYYLGIKKATPILEQQIPQGEWDKFMAFIRAWKSLFGFTK